MLSRTRELVLTSERRFQPADGASALSDSPRPVLSTSCLTSVSLASLRPGDFMPNTTPVADRNSTKCDAQKQIIALFRRRFEATRYVLDGVSNQELVAEYKAKHAAQVRRIARRVADRERLNPFPERREA
jgi:hypothetical protein